jgi:hypothetical protein
MSFDLASVFPVGEIDYVKLSIQAFKEIIEKNNKCTEVVKEGSKLYIKIDLTCTGIVELSGEDILFRIPKRGK